MVDVSRLHGLRRKHSPATRRGEQALGRLSGLAWRVGNYFLIATSFKWSAAQISRASPRASSSREPIVNLVQL